MQIDPDVVSFLLSMPGFLATRDAGLQPEVVEACMLELDPETGIGVVAAMTRFARKTLDNLRDNGACAVVISRAFLDHRSVQVKGHCLQVSEPVRAPERLRVPVEGLAKELPNIGASPEAVAAYRALATELHYQVTVQVEQVYQQTPGPGAGSRVA